MSDPDAYPDEMRIFRTLSDGDAERVLAGEAAADQPELTGFLSELRAVYTEAPAMPTEVIHLAAIAQDGVVSTDGATPPKPSPTRAAGLPRRRWWTAPRRRLVLLGAGLALALPLATAGLALAGVSLPGVARAPFEQLGIDLPNQSSSTDVQSVIESTPTDQRGCAFGQEVSRAASGRAGPSVDPCTRRGDHGGVNPKSEDHGPGSAGRSFGAQTAQSAQQNASQDGQAFGQSTSQGAQQLGQQQAASGEATGEQHSSSGQATGDQNSAAGEAIGEQHAVGPGAPGVHGR
jgi:hypothetical protein